MLAYASFETTLDEVVARYRCTRASDILILLSNHYEILKPEADLPLLTETNLPVIADTGR